MSLSSENMLKLMAYADGELEGDEREEAEKLLATDPDSVRFVEQLGGLGDLARLGYAAKTGKSVAKFDIADTVMSLAKPSNVSSLAAARERNTAAGGGGGAQKNKNENENKKKGSGATVGVAIVAVLALAASVFVFAQHRTDETPMARGPAVRDTAAQAGQPGQAAPATSVASTVEPSGRSSGAGVDVSTVNSPGNSVSVFYLPTANELSTSVVVWVDETGEK
jgi:anti-sigma factor RsiW